MGFEKSKGYLRQEGAPNLHLQLQLRLQRCTANHDENKTRYALEVQYNWIAKCAGGRTFRGDVALVDVELEGGVLHWHLRVILPQAVVVARFLQSEVYAPQ
jgi:hypothetical protein